MTRLAIACSLLLSVLLAACGSAADVGRSSGAPATLAGSAWRAVSVAGTAPVAGSEPTIAFTDSETSGNTGCNGYFGGYTYADGTIAFTNVGMTMMACDGPIGTVEMAYTQALNAATTAALDDGGQLLLSGPGGEILFRPDSPPAG